MANHKQNNANFTPNHYGTQPRKYRANKGAKFENKSNEQPQLIQTKGE